MSRERVNKLIGGLVTVTLATGQVPALSLAEQTEPAPAGVEQGQAGPANQDNPAATDSVPEQDGPSSDAAGQADEPAPIAAADSQTPLETTGTESTADEQPADSKQPVAVTVSEPQELNYHAGDLTEGMLYSFLADSFAEGSEDFTYRIVHQLPEGGDGGSVTADPNWWVNDSPLALANGTYRVECQMGAEESPTSEWAVVGTMVLQSIVDVTFTVSGYDGEDGGAVFAGGEPVPSEFTTPEGESLDFTVCDVNGYTVSSVKSGTAELTPDDNGTYTIICNDDVDVTITYTADSRTATHIAVEGGTLHYNGAPADVAAWVEDESETRLDVTPAITYSGTTYDGQAYYSQDTAPTLPGEYEATVIYDGNDAYAPCGAEVELTIEPRPVIVITGDADTVVSGDDDPENLYWYWFSDQRANTKWKGDEAQEVAWGITVTCAGAGAQVPGTYDIMASTAHPELFDIHLMVGEYTVLPRLTLTAEHSDADVNEFRQMAANDTDYGVEKDSTVTLSAGAVEDGWQFAGWKVVSGDATIADATAPETTLTVGEGNVVVEVLYTQVEPTGPTDPSKPEEPGTPEGPTDPKPGDKPEGPSEPSKPGDSPATPEEPADPSKPSDTPATPNDPSSPSGPQAPAEPSANPSGKPAPSGTNAAGPSQAPATQKPAIPQTADETPDATTPAVTGGILALLAGAVAALRRRLG